jgi:hypothetical protein
MSGTNLVQPSTRIASKANSTINLTVRASAPHGSSIRAPAIFDRVGSLRASSALFTPQAAVLYD